MNTLFYAANEIMSFWWKIELRFSCLMLWRKIDFCSHTTRCCAVHSLQPLQFFCAAPAETLYSRSNRATSVERVLGLVSRTAFAKLEILETDLKTEIRSSKWISLSIANGWWNAHIFVSFRCAFELQVIWLKGCSYHTHTNTDRAKLQRQRNVNESKWITAAHMKQTSTFWWSVMFSQNQATQQRLVSFSFAHSM